MNVPKFGKDLLTIIFGDATMRGYRAESFVQRLPHGTSCRRTEKLAGLLGTIFPLSKK
jgi:hypothetical protein